MRRKDKGEIMKRRNDEKNPYRNSQSEAYYRMKTNKKEEQSEADLNEEKSKKKKTKKLFGSASDKKQVQKEEQSKQKKGSKRKEASGKNIKSEDVGLNQKNDSGKKTTIKERKKKRKSLFSKSRKVTILTFVVALSFSVLFITLIYRNTKIVKLKYDINELNKQLLELENEKEILGVQMESSNRSDVIEKYAREQLGMDYPKESKITYIKVN